MTIKIISRWTGALLFESEASTVKEALVEGIGKRANLQGADLRGAYLRDAYLQGAYLRGADLRGADLRDAYLRDAYLQGAYLRGAYLRDAYLRDAYLQGAYLRDAYLRGAYLRGAYLRGAYLRDAYLQGAYLQGADLQGADLQGANLRGADLQGANLQNVINNTKIIAQTRICPEGDIIGYKKCVDNTIVKLLIGKDVKRNNAFGRKCRAESAVVLEIYDANGKPIKYTTSRYDTEFSYSIGKTVTPTKPFNEDFTEECASGIHFYITRAEAEVD